MLVLNKVKLSHHLVLMVVLTLLVTILIQAINLLNFDQISRDNAQIYIDSIMNQVEEKISTSVRDIREAAMTISYDKSIQEYLVTEDPLRRMQLNKSIKDSMNYLNASNRNIYNMILVDSRSRTSSLYSTDYHDMFDTLEQQYGFLNKDFDQSVFSAGYTERPGLNTYYYAYIAPVFSSAEDARPRTKIGTCILLNKLDDFQNAIRRIALTDNSLFLIADRDGKIIVSSKTELIGSLFSDLKNDLPDAYEGESNVVWSGRRSIIQSREIKGLGFRMVSILAVEEITSEIGALRSFSFVAMGALALALLFIGSLFFRNVTRPVAKIAGFLESIQGDYKQGEYIKGSHLDSNLLQKRLHIAESNEIGSLAVHINEMLDSNEDMMRRLLTTQSTLYETELEKRQAQYAALQSQINPHFLYNTLNCIQSIGLNCGSMEIVNMSASLVRIFRYATKGGEVVKLKDEVACLKDYLSIMSVRYPEKFETQIDLDEAFLQTDVLKMILQPIVENAVYHGLAHRKGKGRLSVRATREETALWIEISDDGVGIDPVQLDIINGWLIQPDDAGKQEKPDKSIGLINIHRRIRLHYGGDYGLQIASSQSEWTTVRVKLPVEA